jgi:hypothetical protein
LSTFRRTMPFARISRTAICQKGPVARFGALVL